MSRNTSAQGNTTPRIAPEKVLLVNIVRYLLADLQGSDQNLKRLAVRWLYDTEDYDYNFYNVISMLAGRNISDNELTRIRNRMVGTTLIPKWARASYGDKSDKMQNYKIKKRVNRIEFKKYKNK